MAHSLQAFAIDGNYVKKLNLSCYIRANDLKSNDGSRMIPVVVLSFFDKERSFIGEKIIVAVPTSNFDWKIFERQDIAVPKKAKEGAIRIGILTGTGELAIDKIEIKKSSR